jgi:uncharacterized protein (DUF1501 family)
MTSRPNPRRRALLQALAASPLALSLPTLAAEPRSRLLVMVFLYGGNDAYNTFVPYEDALYPRVRPRIAIPRDSVIKVTDRLGFHPSLASLVPAWEARELALVQGIGYAGGTQQHFRDENTAFTGGDGEYYDSGWVTRALTPSSDPMADVVAFDMLDIREMDPMGPFRGGKLRTVQVYYASDLLAKRKLSDCVFERNEAAKRAALDRALPPVPLRTAFGTDPFGQAMRATVELAAADPGLRVIHVTLNGLDNDKHHSVDCHIEQLKWHGDALKRLADGLAALRGGLREVGRWDDTLVATYDEFGRSPMENEDQGTHHGLASTHMVMGGRVKGGLIGPALPVQRLYPIGGPAPTIDTRQLWSTVIEQWWGRPSASVFKGRYAPLDLLRA